MKNLKPISLAFFLLFSFTITDAQFAWQPVGTAGFSPSSIGNISIATFNNEIYTAFSDAGNNYKATVMKYNGTSWDTVGNADFSDGSAGGIVIKIDKYGNPYVLFTDGFNGSKETVMKFNGVSWEVVGSAGFSGIIYYSPPNCLAIDTSGVPYIACLLDIGECCSGGVHVYKFNGTSWDDIFNGGEANQLAFDIDTASKPIIAFDYDQWPNVIVKKYDSSVWNNINASLPAEGYIGAMGIDRLNNIPYLSISPFSQVLAYVWKYNGTNWDTVGTNQIGVNSYGASMAVDNNGTPYLTGSGNVLKFNGTSWDSLSIILNTYGYLHIAIGTGNKPYVGIIDNNQNNKATVLSYEPGCVVPVFQTIGVQAVSICQSNAALLSNYVVGTVGADSLIWEKDGITLSVNTNYYSAFDSGTYHLIATSYCGSNDTSVFKVSYNGFIPPVISLTAATDTVCSGNKVEVFPTGISNLNYYFIGGDAYYDVNGLFFTPPVYNSESLYINAYDQNSCYAKSDTINITVLQSPDVSIAAVSDSICAGVSTGLTASGGNGYSWIATDGLSSFTGTTVTVTPSQTEYIYLSGSNSAGCTNTDSLLITVRYSPIIDSVKASVDSVCYGSNNPQEIILTAYSTDINLTLLWNPGATPGNDVPEYPDSSGFYTVAATNTGGCTVFDSIFIKVHNAPQFNITASADTICEGQSATLTASGNFTFSWEPNQLQGNQVSVTPTINQLYVATAVDQFNCSSFDSVKIIVVSCTGIMQSENEGMINIFPNPSTGIFNFKSNGRNISALSIYDLSGRLIQQIEMKNKPAVQIDLSGYDNSVFILKVKTETAVEVLKLVKQ